MRSTVARVVEESCASPRSLARESGCPMESLAKARTSGAALSLALGPGSPSPGSSPACVAGVREKAVGRSSAIPSTAFPRACSESGMRPGPSARSRREAAPNFSQRSPTGALQPTTVTPSSCPGLARASTTLLAPGGASSDEALGGGHTHACLLRRNCAWARKAWMAGPSPGMTERVSGLWLCIAFEDAHAGRPADSSLRKGSLARTGYGVHTLRVGGRAPPPSPARKASGGEGRLGQSPSGVGGASPRRFVGGKARPSMAALAQPARRSRRPLASPGRPHPLPLPATRLRRAGGGRSEKPKRVNLVARYGGA